MHIQLISAPRNGAPVGGPLRYHLRTSEVADINIRILDFENELRGEKIFYNTAEVNLDIAPMLRDQLHFHPTLGETGFTDLALTRFRPVRVRVEACATSDPDDPSVVEAFPECTFSPGVAPCADATMLTTMPLHRILPQGASEEITLLSTDRQAVTVIAQRGNDAQAVCYEAAYDGPVAFRLNSADFPEAESITVDAGACGRVVYTMVRPVEGSVRLAWRSMAGSVEHYTFPVETTRSIHAVRHTVLGVDGYKSRIVSETHHTVRSAFEQGAVTEALSDVLLSPEVWWVQSPDRYVSIDVLTTDAVIHRHGTLSDLEITFRLSNPETTPWN